MYKRQIRADKSRRYVVPSAPGKRNKNDTKVTDMLYACYEAASTGASYGKLLSAIKERYEQIIDGLELNLNLDYEFKTIEENFIAKKGSDYAASRGEYLNGIIMSHYPVSYTHLKSQTRPNLPTAASGCVCHPTG